MIYLSAFDDEIVMDLKLSNIKIGDWEPMSKADWSEKVPKYEFKALENLDDFQSITSWADEVQNDEADDSFDSEEVEVTFYDEDSGEYEIVKEEDDKVEDDKVEEDEVDVEKVVERVRIIEDSTVLEGKLNWVSTSAPISESSYLDERDYPPLGTLPPRRKRVTLPRLGKKVKPFQVLIKLANKVSITITKPEKPICKFVEQGMPCKNKVCRFRHPEGTVPPTLAKPVVKK